VSWIKTKPTIEKARPDKAAATLAAVLLTLAQGPSRPAI
jgi:hypothetical protein